MEAQATGTKLHPVLWVAAVAVIVLSAAGVGAIFGVIPTVGSSSKQAEPVASAVQAPAAAPAPSPAPAKSAEQAPAESKPAPAKKVAAAKPAEPKPEPKAEAQPAQVVVQPAPVPAAPPAICVNCGSIESIVEKTQKGDGTGIGAVAGGVAGAVLGSQVGKGSGKTAATVIGAAGGAVAGHQAERYIRKTSKWEIIVHMEDGSVREFDVASQPVWRVGDKVKVENGVIVAR
ncbi:MAG: glycine zipper 2TM domain-containing protein [Rhodocyclaceae bacterium]|jgi:outer membrane lipoprotein SlyB|nr:glycine zipper 2TM domain-containing protein [Rhodocyclaceae bacterium]